MIYYLVSLIPAGKVLTYGQIGRVLKISPREVGYWLHRNPDPEKVPCHRVVFADGRLSPAYAFGGIGAQRNKLLAEGVVFSGQKVNLQISLFKLNPVFQSYLYLRQKFGPPGPWPWYGQRKHTEEEIVIGAMLTQRVSWRNVELVLNELRRRRLNSLAAFCRFGQKDFVSLQLLLKPSGFYKQKAARLFNLVRWVISQFGSWRNFKEHPTDFLRQKLLAQKGVGEETADTILLYALRRPVFVIDEYTKRFVKKHRLTAATGYAALQGFFTGRLPSSVKLCQDFHALIVRWGKER